ncbi:MAG: hypothetical protein HY422_02475 [Candidatus Komeilibacteria bacterium]|nr:hypothetical protein [Candidatus Komeilibacteria bacterium]
MYDVIVGNIGYVYSGEDATVARRTYVEYVRQSEYGTGRASGESVMLLYNDEPILEFAGRNDIIGEIE